MLLRRKFDIPLDTMISAAIPANAIHHALLRF